MHKSGEVFVKQHIYHGNILKAERCPFAKGEFAILSLSVVDFSILPLAYKS
jgi:hypothetical protein